MLPCETNDGYSILKFDGYSRSIFLFIFLNSIPAEYIFHHFQLGIPFYQLLINTILDFVNYLLINVHLVIARISSITRFFINNGLFIEKLHNTLGRDITEF